jgi:lipopolysaccharide/colanic/teichoic acid biosynthesis glycosyltransferase
MHIFRYKRYAVTQLVLDGLSLWPIWACSIRLRIALDPLTQRQLSAFDSPGWVPPLGLVIPLFLLVSARLKLYSAPNEIGPWKVMAWAAENSLVICAITVLTTFFSLQVGAGVSRIFVLCTVPVTFVFLTVARCAALAAFAFTQNRSSLPRIAVIGHSSDVKRFIPRMEGQVRSAIRGLILPDGTDVNYRTEGIKVLGTTSQIAEIINTERLDTVIVVDGLFPEAELERCRAVFRRMGMPVNFALGLDPHMDAQSILLPPTNGNEWAGLNGLRVFNLQTASVTRAQDAVKRAFDLLFSLVLLALTGPAMLLVAIIVKLSSDGPVLEKAPRVGKGGRHFTCLKFRTTYEDLNRPAPAGWNIAEGDVSELQHATPLGLFLRRYCIDELPQLINILRGEMSLVGPRPLPAHCLGPDGMSTEFADWSEQRAQVCPGLTGLWQVEKRGNVALAEMIELDLDYINHRSFLFDLGIILKTPIAVFNGPAGSPAPLAGLNQ